MYAPYGAMNRNNAVGILEQEGMNCRADTHEAIQWRWGVGQPPTDDYFAAKARGIVLFVVDVDDEDVSAMCALEVVS